MLLGCGQNEVESRMLLVFCCENDCALTLAGTEEETRGCLSVLRDGLGRDAANNANPLESEWEEPIRVQVPETDAT